MKYKMQSKLFKNPSFSSINQLAQLRIPFVFVINFAKTDIRLFPIPANTNDILYKFPNSTNCSETKNSQNINLSIQETDFENYKQKFSYIQNKIKEGKITQINLTQASPITIDKTLKEIYFASNALYKLYLPNHFIVFSPETFVKIENNTLITHPMKGTIDASIKNAEENILNDKKEIEEHQKVVEMVKSEFSNLSENVWVERRRYISKIKTKTKTLLQVSSEICAKLQPNWQDNLGDLLNSILPAASICGVPKNEAIEIINKIEDYDRGFYSGVMGIFTGESLDSGVMIRFIEKNGENYFYKSGGGITELSDVEKEFSELKNKIYVPIY